LFESALQAAAQTEGLCTLRIPAQQAALGLFALVNGLLNHATLDPSSVQSLHDAERVIGAYLVGIGCSPDENASSPAP
jgi:hypothetical protein